MVNSCLTNLERVLVVLRSDRSNSRRKNNKMAKSKLRMTGFARLLIALIFIVPLAYLGATFIEGGEGLNDLKKMVGMETTEVEEVEMTEEAVQKPRVLSSEWEETEEEVGLTPEALAPPPMEKAGEDEEAMKELRDKLNEMYDENSALKEEIVKLRKELGKKNE